MLHRQQRSELEQASRVPVSSQKPPEAGAIARQAVTRAARQARKPHRRHLAGKGEGDTRMAGHQRVAMLPFRLGDVPLFGINSAGLVPSLSLRARIFRRRFGGVLLPVREVGRFGRSDWLQHSTLRLDALCVPFIRRCAPPYSPARELPRSPSGERRLRRVLHTSLSGPSNAAMITKVAADPSRRHLPDLLRRRRWSGCRRRRRCRQADARARRGAGVNKSSSRAGRRPSPPALGW